MSNETRNRNPRAATYLEPTAFDGPLEAEEGPRFTSPVDIHVHSIRRRLADPDGISAKAVIDSLVRERILEDDSPKYVRQVTYSQEKGVEDKTIITISDE